MAEGFLNPQSPQKFQSCLKMTSKVPTLFNKSQYCVKIFWPLCNNFIFQILNSSHDEIQTVQTDGGENGAGAEQSETSSEKR